MTTWEHRTVVVVAGDDGPVDAIGREGWEPYAAVPHVMSGPGVYDTTHVAVHLKRIVEG